MNSNRCNPQGTSCPRKKRIRRCAPVRLQIFIASSLKERRQWEEGNLKTAIKCWSKWEWGAFGHQLQVLQSKLEKEEKRTEKSQHGFMSCRTVKSSLLGWKDSSSVNPWVSIPSSLLHPSLYLYLSLLQWWGQRKALTAPSLPSSPLPPCLLLWVSLGEACRLD